MVSPVLPESGWNKHWQKTEIPRPSSPRGCVCRVFIFKAPGSALTLTLALPLYF